jgi:hypothetical protein
VQTPIAKVAQPFGWQSSPASDAKNKMPHVGRGDVAPNVGQTRPDSSCLATPDATGAPIQPGPGTPKFIRIHVLAAMVDAQIKRSSIAGKYSRIEGAAIDYTLYNTAIQK